MDSPSIKIRYFLQAIFYVLVIVFAGLQYDEGPRMDLRHDQSHEMNQIPQDPLDTENEVKVWNDQDLVERSGLTAPAYQKISKKNNFMSLFLQNVMYPVWSPPPKA